MEASLVSMGVRQMLMLNMVTAASILLIWYLTHKAENAKWRTLRTDEVKDREAERKERERQATEHMEKWNSMLKQHQDETDRLLRQHSADNDRMYRLLERQTQVNEVHAGLLQIISTRMDSTYPLNKG